MKNIHRRLEIEYINPYCIPSATDEPVTKQVLSLRQKVNHLAGVPSATMEGNNAHNNQTI